MYDQVFYYVSIGRIDGTAPGLEKAFGQRFFLSKGDAENFAEKEKKEFKQTIFGESGIRISKAVKVFNGPVYECGCYEKDQGEIAGDILDVIE